MKENNSTSDREVRYLKRTIKKQELDKSANEINIKVLNDCTEYYKNHSEYYKNYSVSIYNNFCQMSQYYYDLCDKYVSVSTELEMLKNSESVLSNASNVSNQEIIYDLNN